MSKFTGGPRPHLALSEAGVIGVMVLIVAVLVITGVKPLTAVLITGCAGLAGAVIVWACTTGKLLGLLRSAWAELPASS
ncbi:hypothetical protein [Streptomyces xinghaiensis]|uniref:hypothetical protein n=1 Tax=Streptomyces xinghaiensis TaxID=1038928 RepID=UPI0002DC27DF|nr:hypothetical protein [Streptomyces xinghaiensis]MZE76807.1 hypothetical protein [Streptomyces sp. SID5475]